MKSSLVNMRFDISNHELIKGMDKIIKMEEVNIILKEEIDQLYYPLVALIRNVPFLFNE